MNNKQGQFWLITIVKINYFSNISRWVFINKDIETYKKKRTKHILELKHIITELKSLKGLNNRLDHPEERMGELEDKSFEIIQLEEKKEKSKRKTKKKARGLMGNH